MSENSLLKKKYNAYLSKRENKPIYSMLGGFFLQSF